MNKEYVLVDVSDHIALVTMNRPPVNALNLVLFENLTEVFEVLAMDSDVHAIMLTGQGRTFCGGADLKDPTRGDAAADARRLRRASEAFFTVLACQKPTVVAINGPAIGAGLVLAASCDILLAAADAFVSLPEVSVGMLGGARHVMRLLGHSLTRRMMFTGHRVSAEELFRIGAIEKCVTHDSLTAEARTIATEIATKDPQITQLAKRALNDTEFMTLRDAYAYEQALVGDLLDRRRQRERALREEVKNG